VIAISNPTTPKPPTPQVSAHSSIDTATLKLLARLESRGCDEDLVELRQADEEVAAFMKAMNENRAAADVRHLFP
jgi:hypothetical protein